MTRFERSKDGSNSTSVHTVYVHTEPTTSRASSEADPARSQDTAVLDGYCDVSEEVRVLVASHMHSTPALFIPINRAASGEEGLHPAHRKRGLTSGKARTMDSIVTRKVVWPCEVVVFTIQGQPPVYSKMSLALFVNGYLMVVSEESKDIKAILLHHLQELTEDTEIYGWKTVRDFHTAWL